MLNISLADQFRRRLSQTIEQLEGRVDSKIEEAMDTLKSDPGKLHECLLEMKKAQLNKQTEIVSKYAEQLQVVYDEVEKKNSGIRDRINYVQEWLEAPMINYMKLLEETDFKPTLLEMFNRNLQSFEVHIKAKMVPITNAFSAKLENYEVSSKQVIEEMKELFEGLNYLFLLKDKHTHNLESLSGVFASSQEGL